MRKFVKFCEIFLFLLFLILIPFLKDKLSIIFIIPIFIIIYIISGKINIKHFGLILFISALIIRLISIKYLNVEIVDDFKTMLDASRSLIKGNLDFTNSFYFTAFPYQIGHVLYQAFLLKIFNSVFFLKIINSIITSLIVLFIYLISREIVNEKISKVISIMYLLYFYPIYLNSVLTNQHLPALLILISIYLLIKKPDTYKYTFIISTILAICNVFRTESIIFIIGIFIYRLLFINKENKKKTIINSIILISTYLIVTNLISLLVYISPINKNLNNNYPEWKFYCGLSEKYTGVYNEEDQEIFFNSDNKKELLINRIKEEKFRLPIIILKKEIVLWTQTNYDVESNNKLFLLFNQGYLNVIILLLVITLIPNKEETNKNVLLIKIFLALYYGIYMFIEISPRYAYILHILIFLIIGTKIEKLGGKLWKRKI